MKVVQDEWGGVETFCSDAEEAYHYREVGISMVKTGMRLYGDGDWSGGWILAAEDKHHADKAYYIKTEKMGKVIAVETKVNADLSRVLDISWNDIESIPNWNPTVRDFNVLINYSDHTRLVYNASHDVLGGLLSSRDFVDVNSWRKIGDAYCLAGRSVQYPHMPPQKGKVRGQNLIGWMRITESVGREGFTDVCLMASADFKGMVPRSIVERGMTHFVVEYVRNFKKYLESHAKK